MSPDKKEGDPGDWARVLRDVAPFLGLGTSLAVTVLLCLGLGYWADGYFGTGSVLFQAGGMFGVAVALYQFFRTVSRK